MLRLRTLLRYDLPLHFILLLTNWFPDNVIFLRLRGWLAKPFFGKCGMDLRLGRNLSFYNPSQIQIGAHVYLAYGCVFIAGTKEISIADQVMLGPYCVLAAQNHTRQNDSYRYGPPQAGAIGIMQGSWLGAHVTVTAGSQIGTGTLVAAGAVVIGIIPDRVLAGGVPARVMRNLSE